jgi:hypothetical protein
MVEPFPIAQTACGSLDAMRSSLERRVRVQSQLDTWSQLARCVQRSPAFQRYQPHPVEAVEALTSGALEQQLHVAAGAPASLFHSLRTSTTLCTSHCTSCLCCIPPPSRMLKAHHRRRRGTGRLGEEKSPNMHTHRLKSSSLATLALLSTLLTLSLATTAESQPHAASAASAQPQVYQPSGHGTALTHGVVDLSKLPTKVPNASASVQTPPPILTDPLTPSQRQAYDDRMPRQASTPL